MEINTYKNKVLEFLQRLSDIRFAGQVLFVIIVLLISWSGIKTIQTNYGLQKQISVLKQQNNVQQLENSNVSLQNDYFDSNQYLELTARQDFGLAASGEQELIVPANVALSYTANLPAPSAPPPASVQQPAYQRHIEAWINFFLHRPNTTD
jgi:cell division protein FtsB